MTVREDDSERGLVVSTVPAVDHHRPSVWGRGGLDPADEGQQASGVVGHAVLRP